MKMHRPLVQSRFLITLNCQLSCCLFFSLTKLYRMNGAKFKSSVNFGTSLTPCHKDSKQKNTETKRGRAMGRTLKHKHEQCTTEDLKMKILEASK